MGLFDYFNKNNIKTATPQDLDQAAFGAAQNSVPGLLGGSSAGAVLSTNNNGKMFWDPNAGQSLISVGSHTISIPGLTAEEKKELAQLEADHKSEEYRQKMDAFKKLTPSLREHIINERKAQEALNAIDTLNVPKSERLIELSNRNSMHHSSWGITSGTSFQLAHAPELASIETLEKVHADATAEELLIED